LLNSFFIIAAKVIFFISQRKDLSKIFDFIFFICTKLALNCDKTRRIIKPKVFPHKQNFLSKSYLSFQKYFIPSLRDYK